jgi:hypothetical protein
MGKNKNEPPFHITVSTLSGVEMSFLVKRDYSCIHLGLLLFEEMMSRGILSRWDRTTTYDLVCDGEKVDWNCKLKDYSISEDVEILPSLVVVLRRTGEEGW